MNEWTNERMNEWTNERMNEWTNERMNEWTNAFYDLYLARDTRGQAQECIFRRSMVFNPLGDYSSANDVGN